MKAVLTGLSAYISVTFQATLNLPAYGGFVFLGILGKKYFLSYE